MHKMDVTMVDGDCAYVHPSPCNHLQQDKLAASAEGILENASGNHFSHTIQPLLPINASVARHRDVLLACGTTNSTSAASRLPYGGGWVHRDASNEFERSTKIQCLDQACALVQSKADLSSMVLLVRTVDSNIIMSFTGTKGFLRIHFICAMNEAEVIQTNW